MENEERNRVMGELFARLDSRHWTPWERQELEAIRECDRKARAWDAMYQEVAMDQGNESWTSLGVRQRMESLLKPTPKDPLEELELLIKKEFKNLENIFWAVPGNPILQAPMNRLLAEIRRLRGKK